MDLVGYQVLFREDARTSAAVRPSGRMRRRRTVERAQNVGHLRKLQKLRTKVTGESYKSYKSYESYRTGSV